MLIRGGSIRLFNSITASFDEHSGAHFQQYVYVIWLWCTKILINSFPSHQLGCEFFYLLRYHSHFDELGGEAFLLSIKCLQGAMHIPML